MLANFINNPETEKEVSNVINKMVHLCYGYRQVQIQVLSEKTNLPTFARLFELVRQLENIKIDEIVRFQVSRGQKITWHDVKPMEVLQDKKPVEILKLIFQLEKDLHLATVRLSKLATDKEDMSLVAFLLDKMIPRQVKYIRRRAGQIRDLERTTDESGVFIVDRLNIMWEIETLERRLEVVLEKREHRDTKDRVPTECCAATWKRGGCN